MLEFLWKYFKGYVIIEVKGPTVERFINLATYRRIPLTNITHTESGIRMTVGIQAFKQLKPIAKKTNAKYRIVFRYGAPFFAHRYRKRKLLFWGLPACLCFLYALTAFIWSVEIVGVDRLSYTAIESAMDTLGIHVGRFKHTITKEAAENHILDTFPEISFINLDIRGTRAILTISENIPEVVVIDRETPIHLVANRDALIESIYLSAGVPLVMPGDVVGKGDQLVSGIISNEIDQTTYYVHASADIRAFVYYSLEFSVPHTYLGLAPTGQTRTSFALNLFGRRLNLPFFGHAFDLYEVSSSYTALNFGEYYPLPIILITTQYREQTHLTHSRDQEALLALVNQMITASILTYFDFSIDIYEIKVYVSHVPSGVDIHAIITTLEDITQAQYLNISLEGE